MGHTDAAQLLQETLDEEKAADEKLSALAEGGINQSAADAAHPAEDDADDTVGVGTSARRIRSTRPSREAASRRQ